MNRLAMLGCLGLLGFVGQGSILVAASQAGAAVPVCIEAETFQETGGWAIDTQFIQPMGSPYLLAHGLGRPVQNATTRVHLPVAGSYRVWVRTKDWVGPWDAPGAPGRFRLWVGGEGVSTEFGVTGANWHWQDGGVLSLEAGWTELRLEDLTGFDGRCDAILLHPQLDYRPPHGGQALERVRREWLGWGDGPEEAGDFDLVVCGGGYAGMAAAVSAARQGLTVALIQDREVLGGNGSSEVRVWANGGTMRGKYPHIGEIVEEFADHAEDSPGLAEQFGDRHKEAVIRAEPNVRLFLGHFAHAVEVEPGVGRIQSVIALEVRRAVEKRIRGRFFVDATGHGVIGALAGARYTLHPQGRMGMSNMWFWQMEDLPQPWPETPWALPLSVGDFPPTVESRAELEGRTFMKGEWFWESGFDQDPLVNAELIRDWNLRAVYGAFSALKHGSEAEVHARADLKWVAYIGGPRESRLLEGDVILTREDIVSGREYPDGCVATTWDIDLHYPKEQYAKKFPDNPFISRAEFGAGVDRYNGYPVPYRCFYSRNVPNLFMAGRCISVSHEALGTTRVMRTCGMMGEVVGKAAYLCVRHDLEPRRIYPEYWSAMDALLSQPGAMRRSSREGDLVRDATIGQVQPYFNKAEDQPEARHTSAGLDPKSLPGWVVDDREAELKGAWSPSRNLSPYVGAGYLYASASVDAEARFVFAVPRSGRYEIRALWVGHENRSSRTICLLERQGQAELRFLLDQRKSSPDESRQGFHSLGVFPLVGGQPVAVVFRTDGADGFVHADAVQWIACD